MDVTRRFAAALAVGAGVSLAGCQSPMMGGFTFWKGSNSPSLGAAPDVNKQKFDGLSQQFSSNQSRAAGQALPGMAPLGSARPAESSNFLTASWKKTTAAVNGSLGNKSKAEDAADDPLRLDRVPSAVHSVLNRYCTYW